MRYKERTTKVVKHLFQGWANALHEKVVVSDSAGHDAWIVLALCYAMQYYEEGWNLPWNESLEKYFVVLSNALSRCTFFFSGSEHFGDPSNSKS